MGDDGVSGNYSFNPWALIEDYRRRVEASRREPVLPSPESAAYEWETEWSEEPLEPIQPTPVTSYSAAVPLEGMRRESESLDPELRGRAQQIVETNLEWIEAAEKRQKALAAGDVEAADKEKLKQERFQRDIETFELFKGILVSTRATAETLEEIRKAREQADRQQRAQANFNRRMAVVAVLLALGSLLAAVVMPFVDHAVFPRDPSPVIQNYYGGSPSPGMGPTPPPAGAP